MLAALGIIFYCSALLCAVVGIISIGSGNPLLPAVLFAGVVSNLFFGAMSFAVSRIVDLLAEVAENTAPPAEDDVEGDESASASRSGSLHEKPGDRYCTWCDRSIPAPHAACSELTGAALMMKDPGRYNSFCRPAIEQQGGLTEAARQLRQRAGK